MEPILKEINEHTTSHTFSEPRGLLFSTQFAQPAITLVSKAAFEDMKSKGLVAPGSTFAGHSLGEYGALSAFTEFIPFQTLMSVVFYRGLTMQVAMDRDEHGSTDFSMVAVNPSRVGKCKSTQPLVLTITNKHSHGRGLNSKSPSNHRRTKQRSYGNRQLQRQRRTIRRRRSCKNNHLSLALKISTTNTFPSSFATSTP